MYLKEVFDFLYIRIPLNLLTLSSEQLSPSLFLWLRGAIEKKNYQILDIVQTWRSQTFYQKKVQTCFKGGGGSKGLVQSSFFVKKFVLGVPEELLSFKIIYILQNIWTSISHTYPSPIRKIPIFDFRNWFCVKMSKLR